MRICWCSRKVRDLGPHHGSIRLIGHAYGEGAAYVPLALRAQQR